MHSTIGAKSALEIPWVVMATPSPLVSWARFVAGLGASDGLRFGSLILPAAIQTTPAVGDKLGTIQGLPLYARFRNEAARRTYGGRFQKNGEGEILLRLSREIGQGKKSVILAASTVINACNQLLSSRWTMLSAVQHDVSAANKLAVRAIHVALPTAHLAISRELRRIHPRRLVHPPSGRSPRTSCLNGAAPPHSICDN